MSAGKQGSRAAARTRAYWHTALARARSLFPEGRRPPRPHAAHVLITWRCNLRCCGCDSWQKPVSDELDAAAWDRVLSDIPPLDIVKIIGGEPFTRADLGDILASIRRRMNPFVVQLVTNGTMTDRIVPFIEKHAWPGLHVRVSLDGGRESHDKARGMPGAFDKAYATLSFLSQIRKRRRFSLAVNFTLTDDSARDMPLLFEKCRAMGVDIVPGFRIKPFQTHCDTRNAKHTLLDMRNPEESFQRLLATRHGARAGFNMAERIFLRVFNRVSMGKHVRGGAAVKFKCLELRRLMYLNPKGELITCGLNQTPIGDIAKDGFAAVWNSERAAAARAPVLECPGCMQGAVEVLSRLYG